VLHFQTDLFHSYKHQYGRIKSQSLKTMSAHHILQDIAKLAKPLYPVSMLQNTLPVMATNLVVKSAPNPAYKEFASTLLL